MAKYQTIATNANNDMHVDAMGNLAVFDDREALANIVLNVFRTNYGELQYNTNDGIPYFATIFNDSPNIRLFEAFLRERALAIPGIESVGAFSYEVKESPITYKQNPAGSIEIKKTTANEVHLNYRMQLNSDIGVITVNG